MKNIYALLFFILVAFACTQKSKTKVPIKNHSFEVAESFLYKNNDSAFYYFNKATSTAKDSLTVAMAFNYMAVIQSDAGDYFGGQESLLLSLNFLNERKKTDFSCISSNYNELGLNSLYFKKYEIALNYYDLAIKFSTNNSFKLRFQNNKALAYQKSGVYAKAIKIYNEIIPKMISDKKEYARTLSNLAKTKWLQNPNYNAEPEFLQALHIRNTEKDQWGQNASYAHLADYYQKKKPDSALSYAQKMYSVAARLNSPDDRLEALQKLIKLSSPTETKQYFQIYQNLDDSLQTTRSAAKNQFALIRYDSEKNRANFLKAQAENVEKQSDILRKNIGLGVLILLFIFGYFLYRKRQKELRREKELEVKKTELKYIKKVHDRVANKVYQVMSEVENTSEMDKAVLTDKLDVIYKISRDLSYESTDVDTKESFPKELLKMLYAYSSAKIDIAVKGNDAGLWQNVKGTTKNEVYLILQNLMTNMDKHSGADSVSIKFERTSERITVLYTDNGKGMQGAVKKNGLSNTETRIESISGRITFDTKPDKGLEIEFSFPI